MFAHMTRMYNILIYIHLCNNIQASTTKNNNNNQTNITKHKQITVLLLVGNFYVYLHFFFCLTRWKRYDDDHYDNSFVGNTSVCRVVDDDETWIK